MSNFMNDTYEENIELEEGEDNEAIGRYTSNRTELHRMGLNVGGWRKPTHRRVQRYDLSRTFCYTR